MKVLVVGYGSIGKRHVDNLLKFPEIQLTICTKRKDLNKDLLNNCKVIESLEKCIEDKPHVGLITNVTSSHIPTAIKLAESGINLFIEKPLSNSIEGVKKLKDLVKNKKLITMMGCNLRFHECLQKIKEILLEDSIGKVLSVHAEFGSFLPDWHPYEDYRKSYASRKDLGGGVVLTCIHEIDYLYWFFGDVDEVFSFSGKHSDLELQVDDLAAILLKFKNNIIGEIHLDYFQRPDFRSCKIIGTKGTIYWDSEINSVKFYDINTKKWIEKIKVNNYERNSMYIKELEYFIKCVKEKKDSKNDIYQGTKTLEIALGAIESSKTKKVVKI